MGPQYCQALRGRRNASVDCSRDMPRFTITSKAKFQLWFYIASERSFSAAFLCLYDQLERVRHVQSLARGTMKRAFTILRPAQATHRGSGKSPPRLGVATAKQDDARQTRGVIPRGLTRRTPATPCPPRSVLEASEAESSSVAASVSAVPVLSAD